MSTRFIWIRHAPTGINDRWIGRTDAPADVPPPEALGPLWDAIGPVDHVITSPLIRARQTAAALFPEQAAQRVAELVEQDFGNWEDRPYTDCPMPAGLDAEALAAFAPPGGENFADLCARVAPAIEKLRTDYTGQTIAIAAHAGTIRAAMVHALDAQAAAGITFQIAHLSLTEIVLSDEGAAVGYTNRLFS